MSDFFPATRVVGRHLCLFPNYCQQLRRVYAKRLSQQVNIVKRHVRHHALHLAYVGAMQPRTVPKLLLRNVLRRADSFQISG